VPYTDRPHGRWKYHVPAELDGSPLRETFVRTLDAAFDTYARWIPALEAHFRARYPKAPQDSDGVYRAVIRAKALDTLRGLLPAATQSNVGVFGTGQGYEALLLRMFAHPLAEVRAHADAMLAELRQIIPAFLTRVDQPARGGRWTEYLAETRRAFEAAAHPIVDGVDDEQRPEVTLTGLRSGGGDQGRRGRAVRPPPRCPTIGCWRSRDGSQPMIGRRCFAPTPASGRTAGTSRAAHSSERRTASTC
jgi:thymidylate synthase ThyX